MTLAVRPEAPLPGLSETASSAQAAQSKALVEARYLVAMHNPRSWDNVRVKLLKACERPGFAEEALYAIKRGRSVITGPSIRFAEEAVRCMGNLSIESPTLYDSQEKRVIRVSVTDLESNVTYAGDITIGKTVERKQLGQGQKAFSSRANSYGETVYLVEATEDEMLMKTNSQMSRAIRTHGLRHLPGDILEEAVNKVTATMQETDKKDPDAAKKRVVDSFYRLGVSPKDLETYLGKKLEQLTSADLEKLRTIYTAMKDGTIAWNDVIEEKNGKSDEAGKPAGGKESLEEIAARKREELRNQGATPPAPAGATPAPAAASTSDELALDQEIADEENGKRKKKP